MRMFFNFMRKKITMDKESSRVLIERHQEEVQHVCGTPIALRLLGTTTVECPHTGEHYHYPVEASGHVTAQCQDREAVLSISDREFMPNHGFTILDCIAENGIVCVNVS